MGGCASRPRDANPEVMPADTPTVHDPSGDPPKQVDAGEASSAEPLVDLSTPRADAPASVAPNDPFSAVSPDQVPLSAPATEAVEEPAAPVVAQSVAVDAHGAAEVKNVTEGAKEKEDKPAAEPEIVEVTPTKQATVAADAPKSQNPETKEIAPAAISA